MKQEDTKRQEFDFLPLTLSIETWGDVSTPLIRRGTPLPTKRSRIFSTATDNQKSVGIEVYLGERLLTKDNLRVGSYLLENLTPAPKGQPEIRVSFEVDRFCSVKVEAVETKSGKKIQATLGETSATITQELIERLIREAEENREEDRARSVLASAELRVREAQEEGSITDNIAKIEASIADLGISLMEHDETRIRTLASNLQELLNAEQYSSAFRGMGDIFEGFFSGPRRVKKVTQSHPVATPKTSQPTQSKKTDSIPVARDYGITLVQSFLENVDPQLELKREAAWEAIESNRADRCSQASHSMREVLRQLLDKLAPVDKVLKAPWYQKPEGMAPVTRKMRVRYALAGSSDVSSESTLSLVSGLAAVVDSMYDKLSAESHSNKLQKVTETRMFLSACETVIGLIASQRYQVGLS